MCKNLTSPGLKSKMSEAVDPTNIWIIVGGLTKTVDNQHNQVTTRCIDYLSTIIMSNINSFCFVDF